MSFFNASHFSEPLLEFAERSGFHRGNRGRTAVAQHKRDAGYPLACSASNGAYRTFNPTAAVTKLIEGNIDR